jgi:hypothetical protein
MPLRLRRGTDSTRTSITPVQGEPIYTTDTKKLFIGDGTTAGGVEIGGTSVSNASDNRIITSDGTSTGLSAETNLSFDGSRLTVTGSVIANSLTGSLQGTATSASYVFNAVSSSFATNSNTASYVLNAVSSSFATNSNTASYVLNAVSSSFATTASYILGGSSFTINSPVNGRVLLSDGTTNAATASTNISWDSGNETLTITNGGVEQIGSYTSTFAGDMVVQGTLNAPSITGSLLYFEFNAGTNTSSGIGIGDGTINNNDYGIGIGDSFGNYSYGIGIGHSNGSNYNTGVGIGYGANTNYDNGVGIGAGANNNYESGIGIGNSALENYTEGVGIGIEAGQNYSGGVGIGASAITNGLGYGTVALGAFSIAQRQNEFVTTATNNVMNKAQSIIQKFRQTSLASSGGIWQEIFTDATSARLTILASSVYQYRIQINAIGATGFICKTWEITGAIKRDASNNTTMVGGAPTFVITSEDTSTENWDVRVNADDTNESLKIEVKHDYVNNVTFSATIWATETRL